jgi:predicted MFS family arabinose efflux permease
VVLLLAVVLGLSGADAATVSATTAELERAFGIGDTQIGLLISAVSLVGALGTVPVGVLTDRTRRTRLVAISIVVWSLALLASGAATSYLWLILARLVLGVATATTGPTVASLAGDYFPPADRGRIYGLILGGELVGTGIGFVGSGDISSVLPWRYAYWWLVLPGLLLAWLVSRLPEPARGGQHRQDGRRQEDPGLAGRAARQADVAPQPALVLHTDPPRRSVWWAIRYVLNVRVLEGQPQQGAQLFLGVPARQDPVSVGAHVGQRADELISLFTGGVFGVTA